MSVNKDGIFFCQNSDKLTSEPLIQLRDVVKAYKTAGDYFYALRSISLDIYANEFLGIIGKSGAGKSTLLNMITGIDNITSGDVLINTNNSPVSIHNLDEDAIAFWRGQTLGVIYQSFQLLPMLTLIENITLPMDLCGLYRAKESRERAYELLRLVELEEHARKLPKYISGGQQQRVAIARALANDPPILIADEPTGSLDSANQAVLLELLSQTNREHGQTIVMITHSASAAEAAERIVYMKDGRILDEND